LPAAFSSLAAPASKTGTNIRKRGKDDASPSMLLLPSESAIPAMSTSTGPRKSNMTPEQERNEKLIRQLYHFAEATSKDTAKFMSLFAEGGYFYDIAAGKKYYGSDIGLTVDIYAAAFPDMHRELGNFYFHDNVVIVELSLNGTHKGDLAMPVGTIPPTGNEMHAPCCDVFTIKDGKVVSFHCYLAATVLFGQLGVLGNLGAALRH
jgi:ketosteroid isomerase-like protein